MSKTLVAYFSATGVTKNFAEKLTAAKGAEIYEIKPKVPYTTEDLDWRNLKSRSSVEMHDKSFRPPIVDNNLDIAEYDCVYVGFPIWWYVAPTIINTFLEAHNFAGKKVVLFATAVSSSWGNTLAELKPSIDASAQIVETKVLLKGHTDKDIEAFAAKY